MEVFRDLFLRGDGSRLASTVEAAERLLTDGWTRDRENERRMRELALPGESHYCFACTGKTKRPSATIFLTNKDAGTLYVSNIVPHGRERLTQVEYNAILEEFYTRFAKAAAAQDGIEIELTGSEVELEHSLSQEAAEKLRRFSDSANRSTGSAHPSDQKRWMDFIASAHRGESQLDAATLYRWLTTIDDWPPEVASQLASEYEFGRNLLAFIAGER